MSMADFLIEIKAMNQEIDVENKLHEQMQNEIKQMRSKNGRW